MAQDKYGCIIATRYTATTTVEWLCTDYITEWVEHGYNPSGITVYYDISSNLQDRYEASMNRYPDYILRAWCNEFEYQMNSDRLAADPISGETNNQYGKWVKDW